MPSSTENPEFPALNTGYNQTFKPERLSLGLVVPIERYDRSPVPELTNHLERVQLAETLGFSAVWLRDVPFNVPSFGDAGQLFDPFVYLGYLAGNTQRIALGVASVVLPLRNPAHVAKSATSVDALSGGRLILGIASGDRPEEYPALNLPYENRGDRFRESYDYIRAMREDYPVFSNTCGTLRGTMDMLPKPQASTLPLLVTGGSQQSTEWIAEHGDGWIVYPRDAATQSKIIGEWRKRIQEAGGPAKPVMEPLYIDLLHDPDAPPQPIHLGLRLGVHALTAYLQSRRDLGINHVALNLRFNQADIEETLYTLADQVLPNINR